jgi:hypothetical protein
MTCGKPVRDIAAAVTDVNNVAVQLESLGEQIDYHCDGDKRYYSVVSSPMSNIYLPHLSLLVQAKLHIGQALAATAAQAVNSG